ncbi:hypothetical protein [Piscinibacter defluvii]|uniref:hypothetical protein n=1 Tax=Piscinibacter defluvii TaxID=1796922 RepID=UPI000FDD8096|nr:hypothetical protein [Piscinibacter defluvii]
MPWTEYHFPPAMNHLDEPVRAKAIAIANALLAEGHDEGMAIRVGIAKAKAWAARRGQDDGYGEVPLNPPWPPPLP